ncbi:(d)CMP kinase [Aerococcaceae bacterium DSM 111020]|nr:(d)CMP kinase [Aerococcaceae bacterium DSM 111020]
MTYQIAIDGPASSGKSTVAKIVADKLNITYIDTGAMYRAVTYFILENEINIEDAESLTKAMSEIDIQFDRNDKRQLIILNNQDVSDDIRSTHVTKHVSAVSAKKIVREKLVAIQQEIATKQSVVMDGRDIGTVVLPQAAYKFYFTADPEVRARRRYDENKEKGILDQSLEELTEEIIRRDHYDMNREISPLKIADDATVIDGTHLTLNEMVEAVLSAVKH